MKAVIIDDEKNHRQSLIDIIELFCDNIDVIGEADNVRSGISLIRDKRPELVFLDIQLSDGTGFEVLQYFSNNEANDFHVIFITAYNNYAIKAFKFSAIDYLLKPINPEELCDAIERARKMNRLSFEKQKLELLLENFKHQSRKTQNIALATMDKISIYRISEIIRCESNDNYTQFHFLDDKPLLVSKTLKEYEYLLSDHGFERVHQSHLVNLSYVRSYEKTDGGGLILTNGDYIPVSQKKREKLINKLKEL